ncbi:hypothetical protein KF840_02985 [bacterium]|nr:hypothetical protein [bacterium]
MEARPIRCRRARRTDAGAIFALLTAAAPAPADRATRHHFRKLVADLGADCYVALRDGTVVGVVHVTYARHLLDGQRATVELVRASEDDVARALAALVRERAARRHCLLIDWRDAPEDGAAEAFASALGARRIGATVRVEIPAPRE